MPALVPDLSLSDKNKERLRRFDDTRPYIHRAAMFALPAMAAGNYLVPKSLEAHKHKILAGLGTAGAAAGLLDRKIEQLGEEHEELRPVLKSYSKNPSVASPSTTPMAKAASAMTRVARNRDELTEMFPGTMAAREGLQKVAFNAGTLRNGFRFVQQGGTVVPGALVGAGLGAMRGAYTAEKGQGLGGAVKGGLIGGVVGGAAGKGLAMAANTNTVSRTVHGAIPGVAQAAQGAATGVRQAFQGARSAFARGAERAAARTAPSAGNSNITEALRNMGRPPIQTGKTVTASAFSKKAGMDTTHEGERPISGRAPFATLSSAAEISNDAVINQMLRGLYANTDAMRKATEEQVMAAFPMSGPHSYGRHRAIGRTADDIKAEIALGYTPKR